MIDFQHCQRRIKHTQELTEYFDFISSLKNKDCNDALNRIVPRINMNEIEEMINDITCISDLHKQFYIKMLNKRKEHIIDYTFSLLNR